MYPKEIASKITVIQGNITAMDVDAIVNAANNDLQMGGGVAGAIHRAGGPVIQSECNKFGPIPVGEAAITTGGNLRARYVIHAASMRLGGRTTRQSLADSTRNSLKRAMEKGLRTIAFPAVGTGIAGFPMRECAEIMLKECLEHLSGETTLEHITFVLYDQEALETFQEVFRELTGL